MYCVFKCWKDTTLLLIYFSNSWFDILDCGMNVTIPNGHVRFNMNRTTFNETASVSCNEGFEIQGEHFIKCQEYGTWSRTSCVEGMNTLDLTLE